MIYFFHTYISDAYICFFFFSAYSLNTGKGSVLAIRCILKVKKGVILDEDKRQARFKERLVFMEISSKLQKEENNRKIS